jgi:type VI secretion system FHA domain protein
MTLKLEIVSGSAAEPSSAASKEFSLQGGTIGRSPDNDWVIADAYVSGHHARVHFRDGHYYLEDTSTNGVFVQTHDNRLTKGQLHQLRSGERFFIDNLEIRVLVDLRNTADSPLDSEGLADLTEAMCNEPETVYNRATTAGRALGKKAELIADHSIDMALYTTPMSDPVSRHMPRLTAEVAPETVDDEIRIIDFKLPKQKAGSARKEHGRASSKKKSVKDPAGSLLHASSDETFFVDEVFGAIPTPQTPSKTSGNDSSLKQQVAAKTKKSNTKPSTDHLKEALEKAGLSLQHVSPDAIENLDRVVSIVMSGLMDVLRARGQFKEEFGMRVTRFKTAENNPLKFSANVEDALHNLFVKRNSAYLSSTEAFDDAFDELRRHQDAVLVGMRVAFDAALRHFDPERLQTHFDAEPKRSALKLGSAKPLYWEQYRKTYRDMVKSPDECFRKLFGEEFAKAYEDQMQHSKKSK